MAYLRFGEDTGLLAAHMGSNFYKYTISEIYILFNSYYFVSDEQQLLSQYKSSLNNLLFAYNSARSSIDNGTCENVFIELDELDESTLTHAINTRNNAAIELQSQVIHKNHQQQLENRILNKSNTTKQTLGPDYGT
eukprot:TRINITY_DN445_c0_g1_i1.p1 TRINITY_DN445_c0_g1~~TRINITY_DN445_c0_g1_i1.p1  ORF type:complete len:136 (+),score=22.27 TRINITY_DN445_c0_g1_i1:70-477(+)